MATMISYTAEDVFRRDAARQYMKMYYGMALDCVRRARLFRGNTGWFDDEVESIASYRRIAKAWMGIAKK